MTEFVILFVNLFQNLGSGYMKLLPEFQIYLQSKKNFYNINHIKKNSAKKSSEAVASLPQWKLRH